MISLDPISPSAFWTEFLHELEIAISSPAPTQEAMTLLDHFLHITNFHSPLLRAIVPCFATAFAIQGAVAIPSILAGSERFYDVSGSVTFLAVGTLSLYLPALRARAAAYAANATTLPRLPSLIEVLKGGAGAGVAVLLNWRQLVLTGMTVVWAIRREPLLLRCFKPGFLEPRGALILQQFGPKPRTVSV